MIFYFCIVQLCGCYAAFSKMFSLVGYSGAGVIGYPSPPISRVLHHHPHSKNIIEHRQKEKPDAGVEPATLR
jgi:hypothetical protein